MFNKDKISVLVIEDNKTVQFIINKLLAESILWKFEIESAYDMTTALDKLSKNSFDIVLSDLELPDSTRSSTLRILQNEMAKLPFIILTATDDDALLLQSIEAGAQNYLFKEHIQQGALLSRSLYNAIQHWEMKAQLKYMATHDELTGTLNKSFFIKTLERTIANSGYLEETFCLVICDLDNFRNVNNKYGHIAGDNALKAFAKVIKSTIRNTDVLGRFGGDEFLLLFRKTNREKCEQYLKKLLSLEIEVPLANFNDEKLFIKGSYGGALYTDGMTAEQMIIKADQALYEVKEKGKGFSKVL